MDVTNNRIKLSAFLRTNVKQRINKMDKIEMNSQFQLKKRGYYEQEENDS